MEIGIKPFDPANLGVAEVNAFIPAKWVAAAIGAHLKLGFSGEGLRVTGFDPDVGDAPCLGRSVPTCSP